MYDLYCMREQAGKKKKYIDGESRINRDQREMLMMMYYVCDNNGGVQIFFHRFDVCFMFCLSNFW